MRLIPQVVLVLAAVAGLAIAASDVVLFERQTAPGAWACDELDDSAPLADHEVFQVWVALRHADGGRAIEAALMRVADPASSDYAKYPTREEIDAMASAVPGAAEAVVNWLAAGGGLVENLGDVVVATVPARLLESLFPRLRVVACRHEKLDGTTLKALGAVSAPAAIAKHVAFITGLTDFILPSKRSVMRPVGDAGQATDLVYPRTVRDLSGIAENQTVTEAAATQAAVEFGIVVRGEKGQNGGGGGGFQFSDLREFAMRGGLPFYNVSDIVGPFQQTNYTWNAESLLDLDYLLHTARNAPTTYATYTFWVFELAATLYNATDPPLVNSLSYATPEYLMCNATLNGANNPTCHLLGVDPAEYIARTNAEFAKLGLRGVTLVSASGDSGAPSEYNVHCDYDASVAPLIPLFPAASPWVLAVGGVAIIEAEPGCPTGAEAEAQPPICAPMAGSCCAHAPFNLTASCVTNGGITSGGGFSNYTTRPPYQDAAVEAFLASASLRPPSNLANFSNRAYPDVAHLATHTIIVIDGETSVGSGTSASTPMVAAIISLWNSHLIANGHGPVGVANPLVYKMAAEHPAAFTDVTNGTNQCTEEACCKYGYGAAPGWDPVTGWGVINFPESIKYINAAVLGI